MADFVHFVIWCQLIFDYKFCNAACIIKTKQVFKRTAIYGYRFRRAPETEKHTENVNTACTK